MMLSSQLVEKRRFGLDKDPPLGIRWVLAERVAQMNDVHASILLFHRNPIRWKGGQHPNCCLDRYCFGPTSRSRQGDSDDFLAITGMEPVHELLLVQEKRTGSTVWHSPSVSGLTSRAEPRRACVSSAVGSSAVLGAGSRAIRQSQKTNGQTRLSHVFTNQLNAIRTGLEPGADHFDKIRAAEMKRRAIVCRITRLHPASDGALIRRTTLSLSVVVRTCGGIDQAKAVVERFEAAK